MRVRALLALPLALGLLVGCHQVKTQPERRMLVSVQPAELAAGSKVSVSARPQPAAVLVSVSGTVAMPGAWVMPFHWDARQQVWAFRTQIPALTFIPAGEYMVKAWGKTADGQLYEGSTLVHFH